MRVATQLEIFRCTLLYYVYDSLNPYMYDVCYLYMIFPEATYIFMLCILYNITLLGSRSRIHAPVNFSFCFFNQPDDDYIF